MASEAVCCFVSFAPVYPSALDPEAWAVLRTVTVPMLLEKETHFTFGT